MKVVLVIGLVLLAMISSGCVEYKDGEITIDTSKISEVKPNLGGGVSLEDLGKNPEIYVNKTIKVKGELFRSYIIDRIEADDYFLADDKGYRINVMAPGGSWVIGNRHISTYKIYSFKGKYTYLEICECQWKREDGQKWVDKYIVEVNDCPEEGWLKEDIVGVKFEYRCKPDSIEKIYYLDVLEID